MSADDLEERIKRIAARYEENCKLAMARGPSLVVDANRLGGLVEALRELRFRVRTLPPGVPDEDLFDGLEKKILITNNTKDFLEASPIYDFGIIALEGLKFHDALPTSKNITARIIAKAISEFSLSSKQNPFVLYLKDDGDHILADL